jgi:hypothetical protein
MYGKERPMVQMDIRAGVVAAGAAFAYKYATNEYDCTLSGSVFKWKISNKWLTLSGIGIGILSSILCNYIEAWANEDVNLVYASMLDKIKKARWENQTRISVLANTL